MSDERFFARGSRRQDLQHLQYSIVQYSTVLPISAPGSCRSAPAQHLPAVGAAAGLAVRRGENRRGTSSGAWAFFRVLPDVNRPGWVDFAGKLLQPHQPSVVVPLLSTRPADHQPFP